MCEALQTDDGCSPGGFPDSGSAEARPPSTAPLRFLCLIWFNRHFTAWGGGLRNPPPLALLCLTDYLPAAARIISPPAAATAPSTFQGWLCSGGRFPLWRQSPSIFSSIFSSRSSAASSNTLPSQSAGAAWWEELLSQALTPEVQAALNLHVYNPRDKKTLLVNDSEVLAHSLSLFIGSKQKYIYLQQMVDKHI